MSTDREVRHGDAGAPEGFSDDGELVQAPSIANDSLFDYLPFEDIDIPPGEPGEGVSGAAGSEYAVIPTELNPRDSGRSEPKAIPDVYRIVDWIMGRNLITEEDRQPAKPSTVTAKADEPNLDRDEEHPTRPKLVDDDFIDIGDVRDICPACTTPYCQAIDSLPFKSSLRLGYNDSEMHTWFIGDKYVMTEAVDDTGPEETAVTLALAVELIKGATRVPVPNVIAGWKEKQKVITISERTPGRRLYDIWWELRDHERRRIAREVGRYVDGWRQLTGDRISSLNSGPVRHHENLFGRRQGGFGPFGSDEQLWGAIQRRLKSRNIDRSVIQTLRDYMPESAPCVLTHGDLSCTNILIHEGKVSAILGFESAAMLPAWAEHVAVHFCCCKEDEQWKAMLSRHVKSYARAKDWWALWSMVENTVPDRKRVATLVARCRRWQKPPKKRRPFDPEASEQERILQDTIYQQPSELGSLLQSPYRGSFQVRTGNRHSRAALSRELLDGLHYSELLHDTRWQTAIHSQPERVELEVEDEIEDEVDDFSITEEQLQAQRTEINEYLRELEQGNMEDEANDEARRIAIERWLSESERGRKAMRPLLLQHMSGEGRETTSYRSPAKETPWRERQRSFERRGNVSKGLRPFSLPLSHLSETIKKDLREIDENYEDDDDDGDGDGDDEEGNESREESIEKALRSLEGGGENVVAAANVTLPQPGDEVRSPDRKRTSIFRERNAPGSLYLAVASAAAEGRNRRTRRSQSEELELREGSRETGPQRQRPRSLMPRVGRI